MINKEKIAAVKEELARLTKAIAAWEATPVTRRTVDITVDAYDAPMFAALAKRRDHQRALGHTDDERMNFMGRNWLLARRGYDGIQWQNAKRCKGIRQLQERMRHHGAMDSDTILMGEVAEVLEAKTDEERIYELLDVAAVCIRLASKMQCDIDAREGGAP